MQPGEGASRRAQRLGTQSTEHNTTKNTKLLSGPGIRAVARKSGTKSLRLSSTASHQSSQSAEVTLYDGPVSPDGEPRSPFNSSMARMWKNRFDASKPQKAEIAKSSERILGEEEVQKAEDRNPMNGIQKRQLRTTSNKERQLPKSILKSSPIEKVVENPIEPSLESTGDNSASAPDTNESHIAGETSPNKTPISEDASSKSPDGPAVTSGSSTPKNSKTPRKRKRNVGAEGDSSPIIEDDALPEDYALPETSSTRQRGTPSKVRFADDEEVQVIEQPKSSGAAPKRQGRKPARNNRNGNRPRTSTTKRGGSQIPEPRNRNQPLDFGKMSPEELPEEVRNNPAWLRACAWMRGATQREEARKRELLERRRQALQEALRQREEEQRRSARQRGDEERQAAHQRYAGTDRERHLERTRRETQEFFNNLMKEQLQANTMAWNG